MGNKNVFIDNIKPISLANGSSLSFCSNSGMCSNASGVIISEVLMGDSTLLSDTPRLSFYKALDFLIEGRYLQPDNAEPVIGEETMVCDGAVIENGVSIGRGCYIGANAVIRTGTVIGNNTKIKSGSVIGNDGFGFVRENGGVPYRFPHIGGVLIGENVEVGSNTCIDKGALLHTEIKDNVKIDNLVHIAHNCVIGENSMIAASAEISGRVHLGRGGWVGPSACISDGISLGDNSSVGIGAVVTKDVDKDVFVAGNPAKKLRALKP